MVLHIGEKIRQLRNYSQLSQIDLVDGICSVPYLSKIENGKIKPSQKVLGQICKRLNIDIMILNMDNATMIHKYFDKIKNKVPENTLTKEEELFLQLSLLAYIPTNLIVRIFTELLKHYLYIKSIKDADYLYNNFYQLIPIEFTDDLEDEDEENLLYELNRQLGNYFYYKQNFSICFVYVILSYGFVCL